MLLHFRWKSMIGNCMQRLISPVRKHARLESHCETTFPYVSRTLEIAFTNRTTSTYLKRRYLDNSHQEEGKIRCKLPADWELGEELSPSSELCSESTSEPLLKSDKLSNSHCSGIRSTSSILPCPYAITSVEIFSCQITSHFQSSILPFMKFLAIVKTILTARSLAF